MNTVTEGGGESAKIQNLNVKFSILSKNTHEPYNVWNGLTICITAY